MLCSLNHRCISVLDTTVLIWFVRQTFLLLTLSEEECSALTGRSFWLLCILLYLSCRTDWICFFTKKRASRSSVWFQVHVYSHKWMEIAVCCCLKILKTHFHGNRSEVVNINIILYLKKECNVRCGGLWSMHTVHAQRPRLCCSDPGLNLTCGHLPHVILLLSVTAFLSIFSYVLNI